MYHNVLVIFCLTDFDVKFCIPKPKSDICYIDLIPLKILDDPLERKLSQSQRQIRERFPNSSIYNINDEPLKCLAALKEGVDLTEEVRYDWSIRWDIAVEETTRFFNQIQTFKGSNQAVREVKMLRLDNK